MNRQMSWGIAALIIVLIAAGSFMYWQWSSVQQLKEQIAQDEKLLEERDKPVAENNLPPAEPGKKWVPHGDHFHQVPIDAPDTWQGEPHEPVAKEVQAKPAYTGPLTYHEELLETHPVKALRLQTEERGHWSAEWIPPFPPDDQEAARVARNKYILQYYKSIGDTDNPAYREAYQDHEFYRSIYAKRYRSVLRPYLDESGLLDKSLDITTRQELIERSYEVRNRANDIFQLSWVDMSPDDVGDLSLYGSPSDPAAPPIMDDR
ncbi:MAG: hypothetical protein OXM61_03095 [Candidatus Poribacteria bacterium]|nr:hypothetical protein [Candidatus Poribacteria bacterium]